MLVAEYEPDEGDDQSQVSVVPLELAGTAPEVVTFKLIVPPVQMAAAALAANVVGVY